MKGDDVYAGCSTMLLSLVIILLMNDSEYLMVRGS